MFELMTHGWASHNLMLPAFTNM